MLMRSHPILSRFLFWIVLPILVLLAVGYGAMLQSLPQKEGVLHLQGLEAPVQVIRDKHAIPRIFAETDQDAFFALGYVHAQDRMWQMTYMTRLAEGRLSEILGVDSLDIDLFMRTLGLSGAAEAALASLDEPALQSLVSYANGVNAWIKEKNRLPAEFYILDTEPELWQPVNSLTLIKLMALNLGQNYQRELSLDMLIKEMGIEKAYEFEPDVNQGESSLAAVAELTDSDMVKELLAKSDTLRRELYINEEGIGSNAWVVSGRFTESGLPMLASDPHLGVEMPAVWYLAEIQGDRIQVSGATYPGLPIVLMGHNQAIAWGTTNMYADAQDLYLERTNPLNENQYEVDGQWRDMEVHEEIIHVKTDFPQFLSEPIPPVQWQVRKTRNGPLISDLTGRTENPLALRWTALDEQDKTYQSFLKVNYAQDWTSFTAALQEYAVPAINFIYADTHGDIGLFGAGKIPVRGNGNGRKPTPGWNSSFDWQGYIPFEELPQTLNPEKGYLVNSNDKNHADNYPYLVANHWGLPYRAGRIHQMIQNHIDAGEKLNTQIFAEMQGDVKSLQFRELLPFLQHLTAETQQQETFLSQVTQWDGVMSEDSVQAALYQVWLRHFNALILGDDLRGTMLHEQRGNTLQRYVSTAVQYSLVGKAVHKDPGLNTDWCDNIGTPETETCAELALIAIDEAYQELERFIGSGKRWEDIHAINYAHSVFTDARLLDFIFDRSTGWGGDRVTVNAGTWNYSDQDKYRIDISAAYRQVIDLSDWDNSGFINSTGQSGNVLSQHYDDNILPFKEMQLWPTRFTAEPGADEASMLQLTPAK